MDGKMKRKPKDGQAPEQPPNPQEEVHQRFRQTQCPQYCNNFTCKLDGICNQECGKLDMAKALICELCDNPCQNEKQRMIMLNTKYYQDKMNEFNKGSIDGTNAIIQRHFYLETRITELKEAILKTSWYEFSKKYEFKKEGSKIKHELLLLRDFMDKAQMEYTKKVDFDKNVQ